MSRGLSIVAIVVVIFLVILVIGADIFISLYLDQKAHDLNTLSDVSQIRSGLEVFLVTNNYYPKASEGLVLNDAYMGTEKLCAEGFKKISDSCTETILNPIPNFDAAQGSVYTYKSTDSAAYQLQFDLSTNFPKFNLKKGPNCATNISITSNACQ